MNRRAAALAAVILVAATGVMTIVWRADSPLLGAGGETGARGRENAQAAAPTETVIEAAGREIHRLRAARLKRLMAAWDAELERFSGSQLEISPEQKALAEESVETLGISDDLCALLDYLKSGEKRKYAREVYVDLMEGRNVLRRLRSGDPEALQELAGISEDNDWKKDWSYETGRSLPLEQAMEFVKTLDPGSAQAATFGIALRSVEVDPQLAFELALEALKAGSLDRSRSANILWQMGQKVPDDADFRMLCEFLPPDSTSYAVSRGRKELLAKWAKKDSAAAVSYVIENPATVEPRSMWRVAEQILGAGQGVVGESLEGIPAGPAREEAFMERLKQSRTMTIKWMRAMPEGLPRDYAFVGGVHRMAYEFPDMAEELAGLIGDPELRAEMLDYVRGIKHALANPGRDLLKNPPKALRWQRLREGNARMSGAQTHASP